MQQLPKKGELWWIVDSSKSTTLKIVKELGVGDLVVLQDYNKEKYVETINWSKLLNPIKATPTFFQRLIGCK